MGYGLQVLNSSGRTVIDTDEGYSGYYYTTITNSSSYGVSLSWSNGKWGTHMLCARPQNNESGVVTIAYTGTAVNFAGNTDPYASFTSAAGVRYIEAASFTSTAPTSPNYGLQCYDSSGNLIFEAIGGKRLDLIAIVSAPTGTTGVTWSMPSGYTFNNIFVGMASLKHFPLATVAPYVPASITGNYAYFNDTAETITFYRRKVQATNTSQQPTYDGSGGFTTVSAYDQAVNDYLVFNTA